MDQSWLQKARLDRVAPKGRENGYLFLFSAEESKAMAKVIATHAMSWQQAVLKNGKDVLHFAGKSGPVWIIRERRAPGAVSHDGRLEESSFSGFRDAVGTTALAIKAAGLKHVQIEFAGTTRPQELGALLGIELAAYSFRDRQAEKETALPVLSLRRNKGKFDADLVGEARARARAVNLARHLVNLSPNELNPESFADLATSRKRKGLTVDVWDARRLEREKMGLHLAVGRGAEHGPRLVHLRWRPAKSGLKPVALVGKGITFDSGGLDIKPSAGMRLMKKDMGGAAAVLAVVLWAAETGCPVPIDAYLALAENAVDAKSFRPGDVVQARSGLRVEIDNTDAEGRLVLADALDVAVTQKGVNEPDAVVDVATLTGAIKVALGSEFAGLFSNDDGLSLELERAGQQAGDLNWRMPLAERYWGSLSSGFADFKNSADGFGGAITAALFLSRFVRARRWAHLDIYAWADKAHGGITGGGSGQAVQCLITWLENRASFQV